ncbi:aromatase/cyclase [Actinokineospora sp. PR83]|uniref:aromatase/cyclase n=1 Tax=Actinokineospora sp. PR83 TaxID=2884908 RepID=UPI001F1D530D|nr:aromatase/cyclase [Actinokineospora sp. PR83]MCG8920580.1 aromatase/cyclase [Actinokineospora sp. PR83]
MSTIHETEHRVEVDAPAALVYRMIADVGNWPVVFPPTVHVEHVERGERGERIRIWATANGAVKGWTSRRDLDPGALRVRFRQEVSQPPVAAMGGEWIVEERGPLACAVRLTHDFAAVDDDPAGVEWISAAVERNSTAELASLKAAAESAERRAALTTTFDDVVRVDGAVEDVYDFINEAGLWSRRLPHVATVRLTEDTPGMQLLEMDTRTADGATHTTKSARVCLPHGQIVYKQSVTPALMSVHTGRWRFEEVDGGTVVTSTHTVVLVPEAIPTVLGPEATVDTAKEYVRTALGRNSTATMLAAKAYAEGRRAAVA